MTNLKNQHFVPRCLFKPFTLGRKGKVVNLYILEADNFQQDQSVKGQCAQDYMYGEDGKVEEGLAHFESEYGMARDRIINGDDAETDLKSLRFFAYLQYRRTQIAIERLQNSNEGFFHDTYGAEAPKEPPFSYFMSQSLELCFKSRHLIEDLKIRIVQNDTEVEFITSDDPAIVTNKFHSQKKKVGGFGVGSSGFILFMPISPLLGVLCYDGLVYTIPNLVNGRVLLKKSTDADALNELHFLKADSTIYFSSWGSRDYIRQQCEKVRNRREKNWFVIKHAVPAGKNESGDAIFREATAEEAKSPGKSLVHTYFKYPIPSQWLSHLQYRSPIKTFGPKESVACGLRREEWLKEGAMQQS